jgi:hypothetical protein
VEAFRVLLGTNQWKEPALKIMVSGFLSQYVQYFPALQEQAINVQLVSLSNQDFCEDDDKKVRLESMKSLVLFARSVPKYASRVADVLIQLLQTEFVDEVQVVKESLLCSFQTFPHDSTVAMFHQLQVGTEVVKNAVARFLIEVLLPVATPQIKGEYLGRFMTLMEAHPMTEREIHILMKLLETAQRKGSLEYNTKMSHLYVKMVTAALESRCTGFQAVVSQLLNYSTYLFRSGISSGPLLFLLTKHLDALDSKEQLHVLKYMAEKVVFCTHLDLFPTWIPLLERVFANYSKELSPTDTKVTLSVLKLEPLLYLLTYYRLKIPHANKENSGVLLSSLQVGRVTLREMVHSIKDSKRIPGAQVQLILKSLENSIRWIQVRKE